MIRYKKIKRENKNKLKKRIYILKKNKIYV